MRNVGIVTWRDGEVTGQPIRLSRDDLAAEGGHGHLLYGGREPNAIVQIGRQGQFDLLELPEMVHERLPSLASITNSHNFM